MPKSPFNVIEICFVAGPTGDQHIFEVGDTREYKERRSRSFCGLTSQEIHSDPEGYVDVTERKDRDPVRSVCQECMKNYKKHPRSPWSVWSKSAKATK